MSINENDQRQNLVEAIRDAVARDNALREKYQIGEKFRFVRDRLQALLEQLEKHQETKQAEEKKQDVQVAADEVLLYVYLYNAQGYTPASWINMLTPKLFYEYSVNRPIYANKQQIEALIQSKSNLALHAFLTFAVKEKDLIKSENPPKDALGNSMLKVREGSLKLERFISLTHGGAEYVLRDTGLTKKT